MTARELLNQLRDAFAGDAAAGLRLAQDHWDEIAGRTAVEDAESCREAMLAAVKVGDFGEAAVWRTRALRRFAAAEWPEGVGMILITEFYRVLADANDGYPNGQTVDVMVASPHGHAILNELEPIASGPDSGYGDFGPDRRFIGRLMHEKHAQLFILEQRYDDALAAFEAAWPFGDAVGKLKVRAGQALANYLRDGGDAYIVETAALIEPARALGRNDIAEWARLNVEAMRAGSRRLHLYELL